jgi:hypothetical protein
MSDTRGMLLHDRWAELRFAIVGPLLAAPPARGELGALLEALSKKVWIHPATGQPVSFGAATIERRFYQARAAGSDRVGALRKQVRKDAGTHRAVTPALGMLLREQHETHPTWSYQLHADNLVVLCEQDSALGACPSYATLRRYMKSTGLLKRRRQPNLNRPGADRARARLEAKEVLSYEVSHVNGLWHSDFHHGSRQVLTRAGTREVPKILGVLDDLSRVGCHAQWYLDEEAESFVHGLKQALQKRDLPSALMTDGGAAMKAAETQMGLHDLSIVWSPTLAYSPYQNGKQEVFWAQIEGRLLPMLEGVPELTLALLNDATQAWLEERSIVETTTASPSPLAAASIMLPYVIGPPTIQAAWERGGRVQVDRLFQRPSVTHLDWLDGAPQPTRVESLACFPALPPDDYTLAAADSLGVAALFAVLAKRSAATLEGASVWRQDRFAVYMRDGADGESLDVLAAWHIRFAAIGSAAAFARMFQTQGLDVTRCGPRDPRAR